MIGGLTVSIWSPLHPLYAQISESDRRAINSKRQLAGKYFDVFATAVILTAGRIAAGVKCLLQLDNWCL